MNLLYIPIQKTAYILLLIALLFASPYGWAEAFRFALDGLPDGWEGQALSKECEKGDESSDVIFCRGMGYVYLSKGSHKFSFESDDMIFTAENGRIGEAESPVFFEDFNYDGLPDVVVRNGNNGNYGAPSYDIYTATPDSDSQYTLNKELTDLAQNYSGLPEFVDPKNKILRVFAKSGCCNHYTDDFEVMPDGTLRQVRTHHLYIDLQTEEWMEVESRWIDGKWQESEPRPWQGSKD